jgi:hypothetical protein
MAMQLAHDHGAHLILLHVAAPLVFYGQLGMTFPVPELQKQKLEDREQSLLEERAAGSGAECRVVEGAATAEILRQKGYWCHSARKAWKGILEGILMSDRFKKSI